MRLKFILRKIFLGILSSSKAPCMFFNLLKNYTSRFSAYNNYYCHDTGCSFEPVFMKFTWLVRFYTICEAYLFYFIIFGNNWFNRTTVRISRTRSRSGTLLLVQGASSGLTQRRFILAAVVELRPCNLYFFVS